MKRGGAGRQRVVTVRPLHLHNQQGAQLERYAQVVRLDLAGNEGDRLRVSASDLQKK